MIKQTLNGNWVLKKEGKGKKILAVVPGTVHQDLQKNGEIPAPYKQDNEINLQWIGKTDWEYSREFAVAETLLQEEHVLLKCHGLDTLSEITVNGKKLPATDNMFRTYEFDVKSLLKTGNNEIKILFLSAAEFIREKEAVRHLNTPCQIAHELPGRSYIRKEQCNFGWDWGPVLVTCGIWKDIELIAYSKTRIEDFHIRQKHTNKKVELNICLATDKAAKDISCEVEVFLAGKKIAAEKQSLQGKSANFAISLKNPKFWWPAGMGYQPLYNIKTCIKDSDGKVIDTIEKRIGLRTIKIVQKKDQWGLSFHFEANGIPFFAKGANWIPADTFAPAVSEKMYRQLLTDSAAANMNMIRVWGGGLYENDEFFDICDELGLCVWQDFMFACSAYPADDKAFLETVRFEAVDNVKRIRHHASLALWCGNNELEAFVTAKECDWPKMPFKEYVKIFDQLLPEVVKEHDPDTDYWPSSPHSPQGDRDDHNNPDCGDAHLWNVWHGKQPFEWYRTSFHRFCSEFGFQSFPEPKTTYYYTDKSDRNITSRVMEHHQRSGIGNTTIMQYMLSWFPMPTGFENTLWMSQMLQGMAITYAVEHWRRNVPRCMGAIYWQLNDCWPVASWASIDYFGRWKAQHYMAKRFFAPVMVSAVEDSVKEDVEIHISSDLLKKAKGKLVWTLTDVTGKVLDKGSGTVDIPVNISRKIKTVKLSSFVKKYGKHNLMLWLELYRGKELVSANFASFVKPKSMDLEDPKISSSVSGKDYEFTVKLKAAKVAMFAFLELSKTDAVFSDNFFHIRPGKEFEITISTRKKISRKEFISQLKIKSIRDMY